MVGQSASPDSFYNAIWYADVLGRLFSADVWMVSQWVISQRSIGLGLAWFSYSDGQQTVYFNDAETLAARLDIIRDSHLGIAGVAIWPLGGEDPANWRALRAARNAGQP